MSEAGELCAVEAIDREGLLVTSEGALVRYLRVTPKNPLVMSDAEREQIGHAFGQLVGRLAAGQSLQFYVEAAPVRLDALLEHSQAEAERARRALRDTDGGRDALRRLHGALRESLERHADAAGGRRRRLLRRRAVPARPARHCGLAPAAARRAGAAGDGARWSVRLSRTAGSRASRCT